MPWSGSKRTVPKSRPPGTLASSAPVASRRSQWLSTQPGVCGVTRCSGSGSAKSVVTSTKTGRDGRKTAKDWTSTVGGTAR